jgi:hypothetical protein
MSNEEMIARSIADELRPWLERIKQLEAANIEKGAEIRLLKELLLNYRDEKRAPDLMSPGESHARARSYS